MTKPIWRPVIKPGSGPIYREIAEVIERAVADGTLSGGSRLPTHRDLAKQLGVTTLTVARAYTEAARRGLIESTVGRGTFVRSNVPRSQDGETRLDLSANVIRGAEDLSLSRTLVADLERLMRPADYPGPPSGSMRHRSAGAMWMARSGVDAAADEVVVTPGAQSTVLALLATLLEPGAVLLSEPLVYPGFRAVISLLGVRVTTVPLDDDGLDPKALDRLCRSTGAKVLYCVPTFQNPTGILTSGARRGEIARVAKKHELTIIEDDVYGFLLGQPSPPLRELLPQQTCYVTSISKSVSPALRLGFLAAPPALLPRIESSLAASITATSTVTAEIFTSALESGEADRVIKRKRELVQKHQRLARRIFGDALGVTHELSPHAWLRLPRSYSAQELVNDASKRGFTVVAGPTFALEPGHDVNHVRIALGATTDTPALETALRTIAALIGGERRLPAVTV